MWLQLVTQRKYDELPCVEIIQDETAYASAQGLRSEYLEERQEARLRSKTTGAGIMASVYINEVFGDIVQFNGELAVRTLEYDGGRWWTSKTMLKDLKRVILLRKAQFPWAIVIWRFDHSSNHTAMADDALNANRMNIGPGGAQAKMRASQVVKYLVQTYLRQQ